jgi:hypothetical protein
MKDLNTTICGMKIGEISVDDTELGQDTEPKKYKYYKHKYIPDDEPEIYEPYDKSDGGRYVENFIWSEWTQEPVNRYVRRMSREGTALSVFETRSTNSEIEIDS